MTEEATIRYIKALEQRIGNAERRLRSLEAQEKAGSVNSGGGIVIGEDGLAIDCTGGGITLFQAFNNNFPGQWSVVTLEDDGVSYFVRYTGVLTLGMEVNNNGQISFIHKDGQPARIRSRAADGSTTFNISQFLRDTSGGNRLKQNLSYGSLDTNFGPALATVAAGLPNVGNSGAGENNAFSPSLNASSLISDYAGIGMLFWGNTAANGANKRARIRFGATSFIADTGTVAANALAWSIYVTILRGTSNTVNWCFGEASFSGNAPAKTHSELTEDLTTALGINVFLTGGAANDITLKGYWIHTLN